MIIDVISIIMLRLHYQGLVNIYFDKQIAEPLSTYIIKKGGFIWQRKIRKELFSSLMEQL